MRAAGEATRQRILEEAEKEFSEYGLAGARINRIAAAARASKERLYAYFPSKDDLWVAVCDQWYVDITTETALRGDDIPGYAGRLFDLFVRKPDVARLQAWLSLEREIEVDPDSTQIQVLSAKLDEIRKAQDRGHIDARWAPVELFIMIAGIARSMALPTAVGKALAKKSGYPALVSARRRAVVDAVRQLIRGSGSPAGD